MPNSPFKTRPDLFFWFWIAVTLLLCAWSPHAWAATNVCTGTYFTNINNVGDADINKFTNNFQSVTIYAYEFDGNCRLVARTWLEPTALKYQKDPNRLVEVVVRNVSDGSLGPCQNWSGSKITNYLLSDPDRRTAHIREVASVAAIAQGVEIDYEGLLVQTKPYLTAFMKELRQTLAAEKKLTMVVNQGANLDLRGMSTYADYIRVMAYYYHYTHSGPGNNVSYQQLAALANYILKDPVNSIPRSKARLVLSLYGWDWPVDPAGPGSKITYVDAMALARSKKATIYRGPNQDTLFFLYQKQGVLHEVWIDDAYSIKRRIRMLVDQNFPAVDIWHMNTGDPNLWTWLRDHARTDCPNLASPNLIAANAVITSIEGASVKVGSPSATLTIRGSGFTDSDVVLCNGNPYIPTQVQSNAITVVIEGRELIRPKACRIVISQHGRSSNPMPLYVVGNPILTAFDPTSVVAGGPAFTLRLLGAGYEPASYVRWNTTTLPTHFISQTELRADVAKSLIAISTTVRVGIVNPTSDGRISQWFTIRKPGTSPLEVAPLEVLKTEPEGGDEDKPHMDDPDQDYPLEEIPFDFSPSDLPWANEPPEPDPMADDPLFGGQPGATPQIPPPAAPAIGPFRIGPNPWTANSNTGGIRFSGEPGTEVRIFTTAGQSVRTLRSDSDIVWDLTNDDGKNVSSGYYIYIVNKGSGGQLRGKLAVIR